MKNIPLLTRKGFILVMVCVFFSAAPGAFCAEALQAIKLPPARMEGGKPLLQALKERATARAFAPDELPAQVLSDLLWAACGINRPETGGRTAPTALNMQEIDVYVVRADGLYLYDAKEQSLLPVRGGDIRAVTGKQEFVKDAPVNLIFVADTARMSSMGKFERDVYAACDTGYISQNVYLFCASEGLNTVARGWVDKGALAATMKLRKSQKIVLCQTVGYPKK